MKVTTRELAGYLAKGLPAVVLYYGEEQGLIAEQATQARQRTLNTEDAEFDAETFHGGDLDPTRFISACRNFPFLAERRLVTVREADQIPAPVRATVLEYIKKPSPSTLLLLLAGPLEAADALRKVCEASADAWCVPFYPLEGPAFKQWLRSGLEKAGKRATPDALDLLALRLEGNTRAAGQEIEKLLLFLGNQTQVTAEEVWAVVGETAQFNTFAWAEAVTAGNAALALRIMDRLLQAGEEPLYLLATLARRLRRFMQARELLAKGEATKAVAGKLKVFWKEESAFFAACQQWSERRLGDGLLHCLEADAGLKGGSMANEQVMEQLVLRLARGAPWRPANLF